MKRPLPAPAIGVVILLLVCVIAYAFIKSSAPVEAGIMPDASSVSRADIAKMKARDHAGEASRARK